MQGEYVNHFRFFLCLFSYIFNDAGDETIEKEKMKEQQKKREIETFVVKEKESLWSNLQ